MRRPLRDLPCCLEVPNSIVSKARHALEMLLLPLGLRPVWEAEACSEGSLYYGENASADGSAVTLSMSPEAASYFEGRTPYDRRQTRWEEWGGRTWPVLFGSDTGPDLIASTFFWLSGWQEYVTLERDQHGRFPFHASLQNALGTAMAPPVDAYRQMLVDRLSAAGIEVSVNSWGENAWVYCPTVDIDHLRKWHPARLIRELRERGLGPMIRGVREYGPRRDPWSKAIGRIIDALVEHRGTTTFFLKAGAYGPHDRPYSLRDATLHKHLQELRHFGFEVGVHPGFHTHTHPRRLLAERERIEETVQMQPHSVRQHYLRHDVLLTPVLHAQAGFRIDSTLGFADHEGFRNGTCLPFRAYDIAADQPLPLWEVPVAAMDGTLFNRRGLNLEDAYRTLTELKSMVRQFSGMLTVIWHNRLWDEAEHPGWGSLFERVLRDAVAGGAGIASLERALSAWSGRVNQT